MHRLLSRSPILLFATKYLFIVFFTTSLIPSFGQYSDTRSSEIIFALLAHQYPNDKPISTIVLTNDNDINPALFPAKMSQHAKFLRDVLLFQPRAIAIDILFLDKRENDQIDDFIEVLKQYKLQNIPVFLANSEGLTTKKIRSDLLDANKELQLFVSVSPSLGTNINGTLAYKYWEKDNYTIASAIADKLEFQEIAEYSPKDEFQIWWSGHLYSTNALYEDAEYVENLNLCSRTLGILSFPFLSNNKFKYFLDLLPNSVQPYTACLYKAEQYEHLRYYPQNKIQSSFVSRHGDKEYVKTLINNKVIFYGTNFDAASDYLRNPVYSNEQNRNVIEGIFFHAMALQNIHDNTNKFDVKPKIYIEVVFLVFAFYSSYVLSKFLGTNRKQLVSSKYLVLASAPLLFVLNISVAYLFMVYGGFAPTNWIAISTASWFTLVTLGLTTTNEENA